MAMAVLAFGFSNYAAAQEADAHTGKWEVVDVYAVDSTGAVDAAETEAVFNDLVTNQTTVYEITDSTFSLNVNGELVGTCAYMLVQPADGSSGVDFVFDASGEQFSDIVYKLRGKSISGTTFITEAGSPDIDSGVTFHQTLEKIQ